jgi:hypothetical protein
MRVETRRWDGYERVREWDPDEGREQYVYVHRLAAVAWGILDGLDDPRHVHHERAIPWYNAEDNLRAVEPDRHGRVTVETRRARADGVGEPDDAPDAPGEVLRGP